MGAIYISPINEDIPESVFKIFRNKGFNLPPTELILDGKKIIVFPKQLIQVKNILHKQNCTLISIGTCFYKNLTYEEGLKQILLDLIDGDLNTSNLCGNYFLLFWNNKKLEFIIDPTCSQSIFFNPETQIISSSFLACIVGKKESLGKKNKINKSALIETFTTGGLIGPETIIEGIFRFESKLHECLPGINKQKNRSSEIKPTENISQTFNEEVNNQLANLNLFFNDFSNVINEFGALSGITGGFDSRLLLLTLNKNKLKVLPFINEKNLASIQLKIANALTQKIGLTLIHPKQKQKNVNTRDNFYFNDGLIRIYQIWTEETKSREYVSKLYTSHKIGFSGIGGEQYRNSDYLLHTNYSLKKWIEGELIIKHSGNCFENNSEKEKIIEQIEKKLNNFFKFDCAGKISFSEIKKIQNEILNNSNRTLRNNIENQLAFFISPFIENTISKTAYNSIPFLGRHHEFEKKMIEKTNKESSEIETDYGYKLKNKVPLKFTLIGILKSVLGLIAYNKLLFGQKNNSYISAKNNDVKNKLHSLNLPVKLEMLKNNTLIAPLIIETEFMLNEMNEFIE
ncbi:MAG: hypothetical protein ACK455_06305 [Bacteroidota bacterium]|jgi:hypothetical protein